LKLFRSSKPPKASELTSWEEKYELRPIVVRKDKQGTSAAEKLIRRGEKTIVNLGESQYYLRVRKDNYRAIAFYNKMGFTKLRDEDARFVMVKNLSTVVSFEEGIFSDAQ
jgi:ribosomal protein S18 acetylase RimI-like enzyme